MDLLPGTPGYAFFYLCKPGKAADPGLLVADRAEVLINGLPTAIETTISQDAWGRVVVSYDVPDEVTEGDQYHVTLFAEYDGMILTPKTVLSGGVATPQIDPDQVAAAVWGAAIVDYVERGTFGHFVTKKLLTACRWLGLR